MALEHPMSTRWTQEQVDEIVAKWDRDHRKMKRLPAWATPSQPTAPLTQLKRSKYGNTKVTDEQGKVHDSNKEFRHWQELQLRERAGEITQLRRQVSFALVVKDPDGIDRLICHYIADFEYIEGAAHIVVDVKSTPTRKKPEYRIKLKLMQALRKIQIREV
jgi:hypothetical protein